MFPYSISADVSKRGMHPAEYLARRRISESKYLLLNTDKSISDIAEEVGYHGATYFGMVFRKYEGMAPSEFRKSYVAAAGALILAAGGIAAAIIKKKRKNGNVA